MASIRKSASPPAPHIPEVTINGVATEPNAAVSVELPDNAAHEYEKEIATADEATLRLRKQLDDIKRSEEYQRQRAQQMAHQQPPSREQLLHAWKQGGMSDADAEFLRSNPVMVDNARLTSLAAHEAAQQGHTRDTDGHRQATKQIFERHLMQAQAAANPTPQPTPEFFQPPAPPPPPDASSMYSAPVSRQEVGSYHREPSPSSVRLSEAEKQIAAVSGISDVDYARNKLKMLREQQSGERQR